MRLGLGSVEVFAQDREQRRRGLGDYSRENYLAGPGGIQQSVDLVVHKIQDGYQHALNDPQAKMRGWVGQILLACGKPPGTRARAQCLLDAFRRQTIYLPDPSNTEYTPSPAAVLCLDPNVCTPGEDCDGLTAALATVYLIAGMNVMLIKQEFAGGGQQHILVAVEDETGNWLAADAGGNPYTNTPVGQRPNAMNETWIDPLAGVAPVIVGVGAAPESSTSGAATASQPWRYEKKHGKVWASRDGYQWLEVAPGLGASVTATQAATDLHNQVAVVIGAGDTYMNASPPEFANAVAAYQAAGAAGATSVGPEIDSVNTAAGTQSLTQQAWNLNKVLAAVPNVTATLSDARGAQSLAKQMLALYTQAIAVANGTVAPPPPGVTAPEAASGITWWQASLLALGIGAVVGGGAYAFQKSRSHRGHRGHRRHR